MISPSRSVKAERFGGHLMRSNWLSLTTRSCGSSAFLIPVLVVIAFGWQELRDRTAATEGSGRKADRLTGLEFVLVHRALIAHHTFAVEIGR